MEKNITLTTEEWDRVMEIIEFSRHSDSSHLNSKIYWQLEGSPSDQTPSAPLSPSSIPPAKKTAAQDKIIQENAFNNVTIRK